MNIAETQITVIFTLQPFSKRRVISFVCHELVKIFFTNFKIIFQSVRFELSPHVYRIVARMTVSDKFIKIEYHWSKFSYVNKVNSRTALVTLSRLFDIMICYIMINLTESRKESLVAPIVL